MTTVSSHRETFSKYVCIWLTLINVSFDLEKGVYMAGCSSSILDTPSSWVAKNGVVGIGK